MANPGYSADVIQQFAAAYRQALLDGHAPPGVPVGAYRKSARAVAADRMGYTPESAVRLHRAALRAGLLDKPRVRVRAGSMPVEAMPAEVDPPSDRVPLSEDQRKFHADWGPDECIAELRRIAEIDTDKVVTRNYFRVHSDISESTWNRFFGTFEEFKRQAEIIISRHAHRMERDIAKHASVDKFRLLNTEKRNWEGRYLRPHGKRWQSCIVLSDFHGLRCDPFVRRVTIDLIARMQPEKIILNGDMIDLANFSKHTQDPRAFEVVAEIKWLHAFLSDVRHAAPDAEVAYLEGNHEARMLRHMAEETSAMMVVLADLHGFNVSKLLGLSDYEVNYIARADLTAWTERDLKQQLRKNYTICWDALLFGHYPEMAKMGYPGSNGHHHKFVVTPYYSPMFGSYSWVQTGCGHVREASYCAAEKWQNGILACHVDTHTRRSQFEMIDLSGVGAFVGGEFYERHEAEPVLDLAA